MSRPAPRLLLFGLLAACGHAPPAGAPIPVEGPVLDVRSLEGDWSGEFTPLADGRHGTIVFELGRGRDTAQGYVVIEGERAGSAPTAATTLRVGSIVMVEGSIAGWLEAYPDFELGCPVDTWFEGRLVQDTLRGMYFAHPLAQDSVRRGIWWAVRRAGPAQDPAKARVEGDEASPGR
jgi:hypothetical protein